MKFIFIMTNGSNRFLGRLGGGLLLLLMLTALNADAQNSDGVRKLFANPPREYASAPLWVWNDWLTEKQIRSTLRHLVGQGVHQVIVHPRPGLMTPYLGDEWFKLWKIALDEAESLNMNVWIYDENSYPSGFAGGWVPELMPESRGKSLSFIETNAAPQWNDDTLAVFRLAGDAAEDVSKEIRAGVALGEGKFLVAAVIHAKNSSWYGGRFYVNLLTPGVTEKFLDITLGAYEREIGEHLGKRVPGIFTDEPYLRNGGLPWCDDLPEQFQQRWGYRLAENLASLSRPVGDWRKVRHNYFKTVNELFIERWAKPYHDRCERLGLEWTGHYWEHEWPNCTGVPDNMAMYAWQQRPAIDCLMNQYSEGPHAQFGNVRAVKELSSVANQLGLKRTLCEVYGAGGWDLRFEDMKRIADWLAVLGINTMDQHLSYITIRGARKNDHPQSFSYHEPWWPAYHVSANYLTRLCAAMAQGQQINRILILEPTTTAWMYQGNRAKLEELGDAFAKFLVALEAAQIEYDLGDEDIIARHGSVEAGKLKIGERKYDRVVLPPGTENLNAKTRSLLEKTSMIAPHVAPGRTDGRLNEAAPDEPLGARTNLLQEIDDIVASLKGDRTQEACYIDRVPNDQGILFHQRRQLADGELLFLVNTSLTNPSSGTVISKFAGVEEWDLNTGETKPFGHTKLDSGEISARFDLPPCGSLLLFFGEQAVETELPREMASAVPFTGSIKVQRLEPNILKLDYLDLAINGASHSNLYYHAAARIAFQTNGFSVNPWDYAVQFKDELISKTFPADSGFSASYRFTIEGTVPKNLAVVIERPDLYTITCNGRPIRAKVKSPKDADTKITPEFKSWWLDKSFGRIPIAKFANAGENVLTLTAKPFNVWHELEATFVLGDFRLKPTQRGFVITADSPLIVAAKPDAPRSTVNLAGTNAPPGWSEQGHPFYSAGVAYAQDFKMAKLSGRYVVTAADWYGSVAEVRVNEKTAGYLVSAPWECDVTKQIKRGDNRIEVVVIGTLKNTLGPHHGKLPLGNVRPHMFRNAPKDGPPPGDTYSTVSYGLFAPFTLTQLTQ